MRRREFITLLSGAAAWPLAARAQQASMPVVGFLHSGSPRPYAGRMAGFRQGLGDTGFVEGKDVALEYRGLDGRVRFTALHFEPRPTRLSVNAATWHFDLAPKQTVSLSVAVSCNKAILGKSVPFFRGLLVASGSCIPCQTIPVAYPLDSFAFRQPGDLPVSGDWDGEGNPIPGTPYWVSLEDITENDILPNAFPATIGAILISAFAGGAICTHLRVGEIGSPPQFIAIALAALAWFSLWLRDANLRRAVGFGG
jgi:hypothetical protein